MSNPIFDFPSQLERTRVNTTFKNISDHILQSFSCKAIDYASPVPIRNYFVRFSELKGRILIRRGGLFEPLEPLLRLTTDNGISLIVAASDGSGNFSFLAGPTEIAQNRFKFQVFYDNKPYLIPVPETTNGLVGDVFLEPVLEFSLTKTISGVVRDNDNQLVSRRVLAYDRVTGGLLSETFSDPVSVEYSLSVPDREINIVVQDDSGAPVLNDLIARVLP